MRVLSFVTLLTLLIAALGTPSLGNISGANVELTLEGLTHTLPATSQKVKRSLRQYDVNEITESQFVDGERTFANKVDDIVKKADDVVGIGNKIPKQLNAAVDKAVMAADDIQAAVKRLAIYPEGLSTATMRQILNVEELRLKDIATWTKETGSGMRRTIEPFEGIKIAPEKYLVAHVGKSLKRYGNDGSRLVSAAVVSRSAKEGGGDVLLISNSKPTKTDWLLPKGGWEQHEGIEHAALREVIEEGGVNAKLLHQLGEFKNGNTHTYYAYKMQAGTVYDDWAESVRYRLWVSYEDAIKLLKDRPHMIDMVKKAKETDELIKAGKLENADPKLAHFVLN